MAARDLYTGNASPRMPAVAVAGETGNATQNALEQQIASMRLEFADVYRELYEAAQMQRKLSGPRTLRREDFEIAAEIFPVRHLSGDFFSVSDLGATTMLAIGDIAGKGLLAGMWFTLILGLTRMFGESLADPALALAALNRHVCSSSPGLPLTSMFLARLDTAAHQLTYCNAGHPAPLLLRGSGRLQFLSDGGPVLGAVPHARFSSVRLSLEPGDTLVGYSDGLLECRNDSNQEFGVDGLVKELLKAAPASSSRILFSIIGAAQDFAGTQAREDDCTLMVVQRGFSP